MECPGCGALIAANAPQCLRCGYPFDTPKVARQTDDAETTRPTAAVASEPMSDNQEAPRRRQVFPYWPLVGVTGGSAIVVVIVIVLILSSILQKQNADLIAPTAPVATGTTTIAPGATASRSTTPNGTIAAGTVTTGKPTVTAPAFDPFMKGVDASSLLMMEDNGAHYADHGAQADFLQILKNNGVNYVRLKLWVNPGNPPQNQPNWNTTPAILTIAQRLKQVGLQFYLDIHYSDTWADAGHQPIPLAWANETPSQLTQTVYTYTKGVFTALQQRQTPPQMVQLGNETNCGMLWPTGNVCANNANWANYASYVNAGIKAVRETSPQTRIALHYAGDGPQWWLDDLRSNGVTDFDVIALSYYVFWHGPLSSLTTAIPTLIATYHKDVLVAEFAYGYSGALPTANGLNPTYPVTPAGQQQLVYDELATIKAAGGSGGFYWEPGWYPVTGAGVVGGQGDGWGNMTLVDLHGNTLPAMQAFSRF